MTVVQQGVKREAVSAEAYRMRLDRCYVEMRDGIRLGVTLYLPDPLPENGSFPALLELLPYRKDDGTILEDIKRYDYFVRRGYVGARVDVRGTGASEGIAVDQYSVQEHQDALEIIEWLSRQPWSNGRVGMWGLSYGGFNSIQVAMLGPAPLKAIVAVGATDDVYTDDIVYRNGALQMESMGRWPVSMLASNGMPGYPDYDIDSQAARDRFAQEPWVLQWLRMQRDGPYWRRISLRPNYAALKVPAFLLGGWLDAYPDSIPRMIENADAPVRAIVGPWPHAWPHEANPGPSIDSNYEILRWWDYWLKGRDTGILDEPPLAVYVQHYYSPEPDLRHIPGKWQYEDGWPIERTQEEIWYPQPQGKLTRALSNSFVCSLEYRPGTGTSNRYRLPHNPAELPGDQRIDDAYSLTFTSPLLEETLEILGYVRAVLHVTTTAPTANWIARLTDVAPDGTSTLITKAILNGAHRESHTELNPFEPGRVYRLNLEMKVASWSFSVGHQFRLAISNADFPNLWPSPEPMTVSLLVDKEHPSHLIMPVCRPTNRSVRFLEPTKPAPGQFAQRPEPQDRWTVTRDELARCTIVFRETKMPAYEVPDPEQPVRVAFGERRWCVVSDDDPAKASVRAEAEHQIKARGDTLLVQARLNIESDAESFHVFAERQLLKNGEEIRSKSWTETIRRDHV